jgi:hypothetical protein
MKVKTNLSSEELMLVSKGLSKLASKQQADGRFVPNNPAEKELLAEAGGSIDEMLNSLKSAVSDLFRGE